MPAPSHFLVAVCQIGAERALKQEVSREHPALHSAFARPGLVTFKSTAATTPITPDFALHSVFARAFAAALGPATDTAAILDAARRITGDRPLRLHVWPRDTSRPGEESPGTDAPAATLADCVRADLLAGGGSLFVPDAVARPADHVLDVIVAPGEPHFLAHHLHSPAHSPHPGGRIPVEVPAGAPSRAYRKLEEALAWSGAPLRADQVAVEIGSAPGGASLSLLRRGLRVVGVDPGAMSEIVLASPHFQHLRIPVGELTRDLLPERVDWLLLDVNLAPQVALHSIRGVVSALRSSLRGVLFTLKLNDWEMAAEIPALLRRISEMGMTEVRATQLPANRQEIFACGRRPGTPASRGTSPRRRGHR